MKKELLYIVGAIVFLLLIAGAVVYGQGNNIIANNQATIKKLDENIAQNSKVYEASRRTQDKNLNEITGYTTDMAGLDLKIRDLHKSNAILETTKVQMSEMNDKNRETKAYLQGQLDGFMERSGFQKEAQPAQ